MDSRPLFVKFESSRLCGMAHSAAQPGAGDGRTQAEMKFLLTWAQPAYNNRAAMSWISPKLQLAARPWLSSSWWAGVCFWVRNRKPASTKSSPHIAWCGSKELWPLMQVSVLAGPLPSRRQTSALVRQPQPGLRNIQAGALFLAAAKN
jgi:hypothetical protein